MSLIQVDNLVKIFETRQTGKGLLGGIRGLFKSEIIKKIAVNDISFEIEPGEIVGYIGMNGAGKSTTIKMLTGILVPTSGYVKVSDIIPYKQRKLNAQNIGAVFGQRTQLIWDLPLEESFELQRYIFGVSKEDYVNRMSQYKKIFDLNEFIRKPVRQLSLGQRMRAEICLSLLHNPRIVYLDEPTIGLDIMAKDSIRQLIRSMNEQYGTTFIITTHDMQDIAELCRRVIVIDNGSIIYDGTQTELREKFGDKKLINIHLNTQVYFLQKIPEIFGLEIVEANNDMLIYRVVEEVRLDTVVSSLFSDLPVKDITIMDDTMESVVKKIYHSKR